MQRKSISISLEAYEKLRVVQQPGESLSQAILRAHWSEHSFTMGQDVLFQIEVRGPFLKEGELDRIEDMRRVGASQDLARSEKANSSAEESPFMTTKAAARYLALSPKTLEGYRVTGGGPRFRKHGSRVVYAKADLESWSENRAYAHTSEMAVKQGKVPV